ncbi:glycosyltransferase family 2 protein [Haloarcula sp. AONF1]
MTCVSVIIPTYDQPNELRRALASAINQSHDKVEIIVVDDGSSDETQAVAKRAANSNESVTAQRHLRNRGGAAARNTGIAAANGDVLAFLDSDDKWSETKIEQQLEYLIEQEWDAVYCDYAYQRKGQFVSARRILSQYLKSRSEEGKPEGGEELIAKILETKFDLGGSSTLMVRADIAQQVNGFDERFSRHQDWEFLIRVLKKGTIGYVDEQLVYKYETGRPDVEKIKAAKNLYFDKFDEEIDDAGEMGVRKQHNFQLSRCYLTQGKFISALYWLLKSEVRLHEVPILFWLILIGIKQRLQ